TWTLDTTPLAEVLRVALRVGWDGIELRRVDFARAAEQGQSAADVLALVRTSGLPVACVGVELGWMYAEGAERRRLLQVFDEQCQRAAALGCVTVMSPVDKGHGDLRRAADSVREVGEAAPRYVTSRTSAATRSSTFSTATSPRASSPGRPPTGSRRAAAWSRSRSSSCGSRRRVTAAS